MSILYTCSATVHVEQSTDTTELYSQAGSPTETETTIRFLRARGTGSEAANEVLHNEDRGFLGDKLINTPLLKLRLQFSLMRYDGPVTILHDFKRLGVPMKEEYLLLWMRYVQKYRAKMGGLFAADDAYVVENLKRFIPDSQLSAVFSAMKKNAKLRSFGVDLEKAATSVV